MMMMMMVVVVLDLLVRRQSAGRFKSQTSAIATLYTWTFDDGLK
jgi:hypothetical protein